MPLCVCDTRSSYASLGDGFVRLLIGVTVCSLVLALPAHAETQYVYHTAFATSFVTVIDTNTRVPPAVPYWGGLDAADFTVTYAAWQGGMLPEWNYSDIVYHAILSTNGSNAKDRLAIAGPVLNTRSVLVALNGEGFWSGEIANPIEYDQYGNLMTGATSVWTGTTVSGVWSGDSAGGWNDPSQYATVGDAYSSNWAWINGATIPGTSAARLYGISPPIVSTLYGEYNNNGVVDAADYVIWRKTLGSSVTLENDEIPGQVTQADFDVWRANFGRVGTVVSGGSSTDNITVPEPPGLAHLLRLVAILLLFAGRERV